MVGVCFWFNIIFVTSLCLAKPKDCPNVCTCLGPFVDCASKNFETIPSDIPKWAIHLELNKNKIKVIEGLNFKSLEHLNVLKLKRNQITELKDGAFYGLKRIDKLMLDNNFLKVISKKWLYGLEALKTLSINHNYINNIEQDSWEFCSALQFLDLSFNKLKSIEEDTFRNLGHLQKLFLNDNNITYIKDKAFVHLARLRNLNLNNNKIWVTVEDSSGVFQGLGDLVKFHLAGNNIKSINTNAFLGLKNVSHLNLANNNITSIQHHAFEELPHLKELEINTTSLLCDCTLKWFFDWLTLKQLKIQAAVCAYPDYLHGQSLLSVTSNLTCDELPKPRLIEEPDPAIMAMKGENVTLACRAMSSSPSPMTFYWKKDNMELVNPNVVVKSKVDVDGNTTETISHLRLLKVENSDAGKYQCVVSNTFGSTYSQKSMISVLVYPTFTKVPKNVTVHAGETVKWECAADGEPPPQIAWHKGGGNDFPAARERRMEVMPLDDVFFIIDAKPIDIGIYSCTAHNVAGTIVANASLVIEERPSLIKKNGDKEVIAGEHVVLECLAKGLPKPTITWRKNGEAIIPTERHFFIHDYQMVIIVDSVQSDSGTYECHLNNSLGEESGKSRIVVKPRPEDNIGLNQKDTFNTSNMLGYIMISVVCCAVLTSIIWVVIIYQTRRKMTPQIIQTEMQELPEGTLSSRTHQLPLQIFPDNLSEHSSCKDSGTGDSAKRSSDDLVPEEFSVVIPNGDTEADNSHAPLLHFPTNHDRIVSRTVEASSDAVEPVDV